MPQVALAVNQVATAAPITHSLESLCSQVGVWPSATIGVPFCSLAGVVGNRRPRRVVVRCQVGFLAAGSGLG